jgi:hemerythrin-like domain-containing protein
MLIKRWAALIPFVVDSLDINSEENKQTILDGVDFIRSYADQYHHAKEEKILFNYFDENLSIIKVMLEDHEKARMHVKVILDAMKRGDSDEVTKHLEGYREILTEHIKKEDEILYPLIDEKLSTTQIGQLFSKFKDVDQQFGDTPKKYEEFIKKLENKFKVKEEVTK